MITTKQKAIELFTEFSKYYKLFNKEKQRGFIVAKQYCQCKMDNLSREIYARGFYIKECVYTSTTHLYLADFNDGVVKTTHFDL